MIFEPQAHYDDEKFENDRDLLIQNLLSGKICTIINVGASLEGTKASIALAEKYGQIYAAVGVHPSEIDELNEETFAWLRKQTGHAKEWCSKAMGKKFPAWCTAIPILRSWRKNL